MDDRSLTSSTIQQQVDFVLGHLHDEQALMRIPDKILLDVLSYLREKRRRADNEYRVAMNQYKASGSVQSLETMQDKAKALQLIARQMSGLRMQLIHSLST